MMALVISLLLTLCSRIMWSESVILLMLLPLFLVTDFCWCLQEMSYWGYCDEVSFFLTYLSMWVTPLMISSSMLIYKNNTNSSLFSRILTVLLLTLIVTFMVKSMFFFYFFFEFSLIPTLLLIMGWGYQVERVQASAYFLMYTMFASLPLLLMIFFLSSWNDIYHFMDLNESETTLNFNFHELLFLWMIMGAFMVKLPLYLFHLWLPKAHVEAPVSGSMILAGVLLKLGGYGFIRFSFMVKSLIMKWGCIAFSLGLVSLLLVGLFCCRSNDMKTLIAYSSISHMGLAFCGLISSYYIGVVGGLFMLLGHGMCSSGMFSFVNMIYQRTGSRSMHMNKGLMNLILSSSLLLFLISITNMSAPPTVNLFSEIFLMMSLIGYSYFCMPLLITGSFMVACYTIFFFSFSQQGKHFMNNFTLIPLSISEMHNLVVHILILNLSFLVMTLII